MAMRLTFHWGRTYQPIKGKSPMIEKMRVMLKKEGLLDQLNVVAELAGVSPSTPKGWFHGDTVSPIERTIGNVVTSVGYDFELVKARDIDVDKELKRAAEWSLKQNSTSKTRVKSARKRTNGRHP